MKPPPAMSPESPNGAASVPAGGLSYDTKSLRQALGTFATGVIVVTTGGVAPHGMTANAFASVSLAPPLVLICVDQGAVMHERLLTAECFGLSVLAASQEALARHFANRWRPLGPAQFSDIEWRPGQQTGAPLIEGAVSHFECQVWRCYDGGDHTIFLGSPLSLYSRVDGEALLFFRGRFGPTTENIGG